ncbi:MAG: rRNA methyltransferase [Bacteroidota bacterium]|nr:rRNA methyltransferase [Bacteroidota bacterium]MDX5430796.1 rRNA methyltransferase [Bacteroidota bacterium]MDX5469541.1 rRNA methyltransferase [Bacteroidota bacterium]
MELPKAFQERIKSQLPQEADFLFSALQEDSPVSIRKNPFKGLSIPESIERIPWNDKGYYLPERPSFTLDPAFHAGMYYVQEASSMSIEFVLNYLNLGPVRALDLCGAPGGKSSLLATHLYERGGFVLANEVIRSRAQTLKENLIKWGLPNIAVSNLDPRQIAKNKVGFDLILVDAPCSGEGMFRKDEDARAEWSTEHVALCAARQKRILSDILPVLNEGGYIIYSTCTFSEEENEENLRWLQEEQGLETLAIPFPEAWHITQKEKEGSIGYAFYPHKTKGEGFFMALLRKPGSKEDSGKSGKNDKSLRIGKKTEAPVASWLSEACHVFEWFDGVYALPQSLEELASPLFQLPLLYFGLKVAESAGKDWKPAPELAFSIIANPDAFPSVELTLKDALHFLKRDDLKFHDQDFGWLRMEYLGQGLGFVKNLGNRSNSQYPKEWRILMGLPENVRTWY